MSETNLLESFSEEVVAREEKRNEQLHYSCELYPNFSYSPQEFYALVRKNLDDQKVPGLEADQVMMRQGGAFSAERLYLRFRRERLVFEICAAPFGTGFFVSSRLFDRRRDASLFDIILLLVFIGLCGAPLAYQFGWMWGVIGVTGLIALLWTIMRIAATETVTWLDRTLSDLPVIGLIYDRFFHPKTYFRQDTNAVYRAAVNFAVKQAVEQMLGPKAVRPLTVDEGRPVLRDLHTR